MNTFYKTLKNAKNEKDVENYYREYINLELKRIIKNPKKEVKIDSPYNTDGVLKYDDNNSNSENRIKMHCLFEFKYDVDLNNKSDKCKVLIQVLYYLKKFELNGNVFIPSTILVGDVNECFVMHTNIIKKYLEYDLDWNIAPSNAASKNLELLKEMINNDEIVTYKFDINDDFYFIDVLNTINEITKENYFKHKITLKNVYRVFKMFKSTLVDKKMSINDEVNLFIQSLVDRKNNYLHPHKQNILVTKGSGEIKINSVRYNEYINFFETDLLPSEKEALTATQDRLIQDETRRRNGEFFTPTIWVDEAHKMISDQFGEDWKEKYIVWDGSCGTGNLTRDYKFKELYCSTLNASDVETMNQAGYNPEATKFQYDFLNDGIVDGKIDIENDSKLPEGLKKALLEGKEIIFFMNPPYAGAGNIKNIKNSSGNKSKVTETMISKMIKNDNIDGSGQLYSQFIYRILKLNKNNINIALFYKPLFLSGSSFKKMRNKFFSSFKFQYGFLMKSSEFDSTSSNWAVSFSIFKNGKNKNNDFFEFDVKEIDDSEIVNSSKKVIYNLINNLSLLKWIKNTSIGEKIDTPQLTSALKIKSDGNGKQLKNSLGYFQNHCNNVYKNNDNVGLYTTSYSENSDGCSIFKENIKKIFTVFSVRKMITVKYANWINDKDEYLAPTEEIQQTDQYKQFENDSIIYSLFNTSSNQSSMRQVEYKDKLWNIKNEFFFMSKDEMKQLSETFNFYELYKDVKTSDDRYVYNLLKTTNLSPDAQDVLETARELVRKSFEWRKIMHSTNPEYHLHAWDAGWYQIKKILNEYFKDDLKTFNKKYKTFEDRLRPQVYELGFLKGEEVEVVE